MGQLLYLYNGGPHVYILCRNVCILDYRILY